MANDIVSLTPDSNSVQALLNYVKTDPYAQTQINVLPNVLQTTLNYAAEKKRIKLVEKAISQEYYHQNRRLDLELEMTLKHNEQEHQRLLQKQRDEYALKFKELDDKALHDKQSMNRYYQDIEKQRKEEARRFDKQFEQIQIERHEALSAVREARQVCTYIKEKMERGIASREERQMYIELMKMCIALPSDISNYAKLFSNALLGE